MDNSNLTAAFISHGGGPLPLLGDAQHAEMVVALQSLAEQLERPETIVVISAHWEADKATLTSAAQPELIYDYYGFPPESYEIKYPAPGHPQLAEELAGCLQDSGIEVVLDPSRGFDHGLFVPLKIMYPEADIPCVQLSLNHNLDPATHIALGKALGMLQRDKVLFLGSGFSFHNMRAFFGPAGADGENLNQAFEAWLEETCGSRELPETERQQRLLDWAQAPGARFCHPREEHLLPLLVCYGIKQQPATHTESLHILGKQASQYYWQP